MAVLTRVPGGHHGSDFFICSNKGKDEPLSCSVFGDPLTPHVPVALAFGKFRPLSKDNLDGFIP